MNRDIVEGNWKQLKGKVAVILGHLTDNWRQVLAGERVKRDGRMQESHGLVNDESMQQLKAFAHTNNDYRWKRHS